MARFLETMFGVTFTVAGLVTLYYELRRHHATGNMTFEALAAGVIVLGIGAGLLAVMFG